MAQDNAVEDLVQRVAREYDGLSKQLKLIAQYITEHRQQMVIVRILDVANACGGVATCSPSNYLFWDGIHPTAQAHNTSFEAKSKPRKA